MAQFDIDLEFELEDRNVYCTVTVDYYYDEGTWYDNNGEGCAPSSYLDWVVRRWFDDDGEDISQPNEINDSDIEELINNFLENN